MCKNNFLRFIETAMQMHVVPAGRGIIKLTQENANSVAIVPIKFHRRPSKCSSVRVLQRDIVICCENVLAVQSDKIQ